MYFYDMTSRLLSLVLCIALLCSCSSETNSDQKADQDDLHALLSERAELVAHPVTPAEVFQNWQIHMDRNEFDEASRWSTEATQEWISFMEAMIEAAAAEEEIVPSQLQGIQCREVGDTAICLFAEEAGDLLRLDSIRLIKQAGIWKVDLWTEDERATQ